MCYNINGKSFLGYQSIQMQTQLFRYLSDIGAEYEQKTTHSVLEAKLGSLSLIDSLVGIVVGRVAPL